MKILMQFDTDPTQLLKEINGSLFKIPNPDGTINVTIQTKIHVDDAWKLKKEVEERLALG